MSSNKEMNQNIQKAHCALIFKRVKNKINRDHENVSSDEEGRVYGTNFLNIGDASNYLDSYYDWLILHRRYGLISPKIDNMLNINNEYNVLSNKKN